MKVIINSDNFLIIKILFSMWIILTIFMFVLSIFVSKKIKYRNYKLGINELFSKDKTSLFLTLGTKVGVGSIIGTTVCVIVGGFGSIIWIILFSFLMSSICYYESYLGKKYRMKNKDNFIGGPYFILRYGINSKILALFSCILLIIVYCFFFQMIQLNTISNIIILNTNINKSIIICCVFLILLITIDLSINSVLKLMNKVVPIMCFIFVIMCFYSIFKNIDTLILSFKYNFDDIFSFKSILSGMVIGIKRSIFMNETLVGTTSVSSAADKNDSDICMRYQVLGMYFISFVITLLISSLLLIYLYNGNIIDDYILLINSVFYMTSGRLGVYLLIITFTLFGFTTILSGYYIGKNYIEYLTGSKALLSIFKILFIIVCLLGIVLDNSIIWKYLDYLLFIMIIINTYSIIKLLGSEKYDR